MRHAGEEHRGHGIAPTFLTFSPFFTLFTVARLVLLPRVIITKVSTVLKRM